MKFNEYVYQRPDIDQLSADFNSLLSDFNNANSDDEQLQTIKKINKLRGNFDSMVNIAYIRYSTDTNNKAYEEEQNFFDKNNPIYQGLENKFYQTVCNSKFRSQLEEKMGSYFFELAEIRLLTFHPDIITDLQRENELGSEYMKLRASAKIMFDGKECNLSDLRAYETASDRDVRRRASAAKWQFFSDNAPTFDRIYDEQVKLRHKMAKKLGFNNFIELGYKRMLRTDYDHEMVANYRKQVKEVIVPIASELRQRQAKRLGIDTFMYYDISSVFKSGNPSPKGSPDWIVNNGKKMYEELSNETGEFINFMINSELLDLVNRKGKAGGGYCTYIENYKAPFIFSNFNGTSHDINVLTHEAGHAFQVYMSRHFDIPEYRWPTYEACEIHSMSMEFLAWPWMENFFKEDTDKFKFEHLSESLLFLPYGVTVDEFQHWVYQNPEATPAERNAAWRSIEQKYQPWVNYGDNEFLNSGGFWQKQSHIYANPFYYIDYTLAQICAFQFWNRANNNRNQALTDYIALCKRGGSQPFLQLVNSAKLQSPFENDTLKQVVAPVSNYLNTINDMAL